MRLYYIGTVVLGMTQTEFWRTTFRKLRALYLHDVEARGTGGRRSGRSPFSDLV